ncbi:MAG: 50S ribosomal protein L29 [Candidatus Woesearchaeota archaeon]|jgi:large subunit ribosomal protein L29|nr:50S ribosomal protein L29 [Candidatus Woesearchaeota archaeon]MDP7476033.1 50S ribosomal protein L29 [Candidatus Woesearchaeota archaeon]HJO01911.1 50S ribosomal protein L29 [Candidatus Woesearchaeota archaeon]|tara:strand:+ start:6637 stop:6864 length:228 start_codon:yes stop_codon:yes gene_type:complete
MKIKEIRSMDKNSLNEKMLELKKELVKMNAQVSTGTALKNPGQVKKIKKTIARILTADQKKKQIDNITKIKNGGR